MTTSPTIIEHPLPYEDINGWVRYYFEVWGSNVIPAPVGDKNKPENQQESFWPVTYQTFKSVRIADEKQEQWINAGEYTGQARGIAIILGRVWAGRMAGKWLVGIDADNQKGLELVCSIFGCATIEELVVKGIVVEQHKEDAPHKGHFYFYSDTPFHNLPSIKTRYAADKSRDWNELAKTNQIPAIELKCAGGGVHFVTPSKHSGGYSYKHVAGSPAVPTLCLNESEAAEIAMNLEKALDNYGDSYFDYTPKTTGKSVYPSLEEMCKPHYIVIKGNNRHLEVRRLGAKLLMKTKMVNPEQSLSEVLEWNRNHCVPPLEEDEVKSGFYRYSISFADKKLKESEAIWNEMQRKSEEAKKRLADIANASTQVTTVSNKGDLDAYNEYKIEQEVLAQPQQQIGKMLAVTKVKKPESPLLEGYNDDYYEYLIDYTSRSVRQEETLLRQIYTTVLSSQASKLANNLSIRAPSSEGKSYPLMEVIRACGALDNEIVVINHITPTALIYQSGGVLVDKAGNDIREEVKELRKQIARLKGKKGKTDELEDKKEELENLLTDSAYRLDLDGKCFVLLEPPKEGLWDLLKAILSHDKFETRHMMTDKGSNGMSTKNVILRGFPAFIFCSAKDESHWSVWEEVLTRFMFTSPNMVTQKYYEGNKVIGMKYGLPNFAKSKVAIFGTAEEHKLAMKCYHYVKNQVKSYYPTPDSNPVWIPFQSQLTELLPYGRGADNRLASRIFQLMIVITLCKAHLRPKLVDNETGQRCVIASLEDLREALHITQNVSGLPPHKLRFYTNIFLKKFKEKTKEKEDRKKNFQANNRTVSQFLDPGDKVFVTSSELADALNQTLPISSRTYNSDKITKTFLDELLNNGYIEKMQDPSTNRTRYVYYPIVELDEEDVTVAETQQKQQKQTSVTRWSNVGKFDKKIHYKALLVSENFKGFADNWLELQLLEDFGCRIQNPNLKIYDKDDKEISIADFIAGYETSKLRLLHFYRLPSGFDKKKSANSEIISPALERCVAKISDESIITNESLSNLVNFDHIDKKSSDSGNVGCQTSTAGGTIEKHANITAIDQKQTTLVQHTPATTSSPYTSLQPTTQSQMLLVQAYDQECQERAKVNNVTKTLQLLAEQRIKISKELMPLYQDSVAVDPEWIDERDWKDDNNNGNGIRHIYAISFVDWEGKERVFHVEDYKDGSSLFERTRNMLNEAFSYWFDNYRLSFGFNSLGKGSDIEVIFENAQHYNTTIQPIEEAVIGEGRNRHVYYRFKERELNHTHIDWYRIFKNKAVHTYIFDQKYRGFSLDTISKALFNVGKYKDADGLYAATNNLTVNEQKEYVLQDSRLLSLLTMAENGNLFGAMRYIAELLELPLPKVCHSQVAQYWTVIYEKMGYKAPALVDKENPETGEIEKVGQNYHFKTVNIVPKSGKNKDKPRTKVISYSGGRVLEPEPGFYRNVIGLDQESQYPSISTLTNVGFETMCCEHREECGQDPTCQIKDTGDPEIDNAGYYICKKRGDSAYKQRLTVFRKARIEAKEKGEKVKDLALKIIINGAYGVFGYKKFPFADTRAAEVITAYGRKMHKAMEELAKSERYNFNVLGGDTDSILIEYPQNNSDKVSAFCEEFKDRFGITIKPSKKVWSKMLITKKKHYIYWELGNEDNATIKGMEGAKNNMPKFTNIIFDQFVKNIGADRDFITDLKRAWTEEYPYCKKHRPDLLQVEVRISKNPTEYASDTLVKRLAIHQGKTKDDTIRYYEIGSENEKKYGLDAYQDHQFINDEIYKQKFFISPFKAVLEQLGYSAEEVFEY